MKPSVHLTIASLLSILLLIIHVADDIAHGIGKAGPPNLIIVPIVVLLVYGTLELAERRSGYVIMLLGSILAMGMPVIHLRGARIGQIVTSSGGCFFLSTLFVLGVTGLYSFILVARGLWRLERGRNKAQGSLGSPR